VAVRASDAYGLDTEPVTLRPRINVVVPSRAASDPRSDAALVHAVRFLGSAAASGMQGSPVPVQLPPPPKVVETLLPEVQAALDDTVRQGDLDDDTDLPYVFDDGDLRDELAAAGLDDGALDRADAALERLEEAAERPTRTAVTARTRRPGSAGRRPTWAGGSVEVPLLLVGRHPRRQLAPLGRGRRDPAPARVQRLPSPLHDLRARPVRGADGAQALGTARGVRSRQAAGEAAIACNKRPITDKQLRGFAYGFEDECPRPRSTARRSAAARWRS
jgi:hypothetical protein